MIKESVMSPLAGEQRQRNGTLYDKLNHLSEEISEGIVNLSDGKRWLVETELRRLKEDANNEISPEAVYNLMLFRKYSQIANQIKDDKLELIANQQQQGNNIIGGGFSAITETGNDDAMLVGMDAAKTNIFWLRLVAAMFSFISYVVMATVPYVSGAHYSPYKHFSVRLKSYQFPLYLCQYFLSVFV